MFHFQNETQNYLKLTEYKVYFAGDLTLLALSRMNRRRLLEGTTMFCYFFCKNFKEHQVLLIAVTISDYPFQAGNKELQEAFAGSPPPRAEQRLRFSVHFALRK